MTRRVVSDDMSGLVQVTVTATGLKDNSDAALFVSFDTDQNSATGDAGIGKPTLSPAAKGKLLEVNLTIRAGGKTAHTVASFRVK